MKNSLIAAAGILAAGIMYFTMAGSPAAAQNAGLSSPGTPPVGRLVDIQVVMWPLATSNPAKISGTLVAMTDQWIIVASGNQETWVPKEKVMTLTASR